MGGKQVPAAKVLRALVARFLFAAHGLLCIWRVSSIYGQSVFWLFGLILVLIFIEGTLLIFYRQANESRWFCTSVFLYLCAAAPSLWFLQLELCRVSIRDLTANRTAIESSSLAEIMGEAATFDFVGYKLTIYIPLEREVWVQLLQQTMLVTLILGRWILPKGDISRDHLSQLLLVFLAMAADMVELFDTFKENQVKYNMRLTCVVLAVWTISTIQFTLVLTGGNSRRNYKRKIARYSSVPLYKTSRSSHSSSLSPADHIYTIDENASFLHLLVRDINFWGILACTFLQDGPFLATRLYFLIAHHTISYTMIFFTCKNTLVVALQFYRLIVICTETSKDRAKESTASRPRDSIDPERVTEFSAPEEGRRTIGPRRPLTATRSAIFVDTDERVIGIASSASVPQALLASRATGELETAPRHKKEPTEAITTGRSTVSGYSDLDTASLRNL